MNFNFGHIDEKVTILKGFNDYSMPPTKLTLPDISENRKVMFISNRAFFADGNIHEVILGENMVSVGESSFAHCHKLRKVQFNNSLVHLGTKSFSHTYLSEVRLPKSVEKIDSKALPNSLTALYLSSPEIMLAPGFLGEFNSWRTPVKIFTQGFNINDLRAYRKKLAYQTIRNDVSLEMYKDLIIPIECTEEGYPLYSFDFEKRNPLWL